VCPSSSVAFRDCLLQASTLSSAVQYWFIRAVTTCALYSGIDDRNAIRKSTQERALVSVSAGIGRFLGRAALKIRGARECSLLGRGSLRSRSCSFSRLNEEARGTVTRTPHATCLRRYRFQPETPPVILKKEKKTKLHGLSPRANYTVRATAACRRSDCQRLRIEGATWSA
jgi:hypothetical protein